MPGFNWRECEGEGPVSGHAAAAAGGGGWRTQLPPGSRHRIVDKIMETLKRHLPFSGQEGLQELKKIAVRFEEKIYTAATSQSDYLRKLSLKMLTMETESQNPMANPLQPNAATNSKNPQDPASQSMQSQMQNQVQQLPIPMVSNQSEGTHDSVSHTHNLNQPEKPKGKKRKAGDEMQGVCDVLREIGDKTDARLRDLTKRIGYDFDVSMKRKEAFELLGAIEGLSLGDRFDVCDLLAKEIEKLDVFMGLPHDAREAYVTRILSSLRM